LFLGQDGIPDSNQKLLLFWGYEKWKRIFRKSQVAVFTSIVS